MPQASLLGWLSKPKGSQEPVLEKLSTTQGVVPEAEAEAISLQKSPLSTPQELVSTESGAVSPGEQTSTSYLTHGERVLPPNIELRACVKEDISRLKRLNGLLLPIPYPESFYREIIQDPLTNNITLVAVWHDSLDASSKSRGHLIGAIRCRLFAHPPTSTSSPKQKKEGPMLYLSTLVLLSPYRALGIASRMLDLLTKRAVSDYGITSIGAHVWEDNIEGLEWYRRRGFREVGKEDGYYRRLKPAGAVVMQREIGILDLLSG